MTLTMHVLFLIVVSAVLTAGALTRANDVSFSSTAQVQVDTSTVTHQVDKLFLGCHTDLGFAHEQVDRKLTIRLWFYFD